MTESAKNAELIANLEHNTTKKIHAAFILLLSNYESLTDTSTWPSIYEKPVELLNIEKELLERAVNLGNIIDMDGCAKRNEIEKIFEFKNTVASIERSLQTYILYAQQLEQILNELPLVIGAVEIDENYVLSSCLAFAEYGTDNLADMPNRMKQIISCFPVEMPDERFAAYLNSGLLASLPSESKLIVDNLILLHKINFKANSVPEYGLFFPELRFDLEKIKCDMSEGIELSRVDYFRSALDNFYREVNDIRDRLFIVYESVNFLIIIYNFVTSLDSLFDDNFVRKDLYYALRGIQTSQDSIFFDDRIIQLLNTESEKIIDELQDTNVACVNLLRATNLSTLNIEDAAIHRAWAIITDALYENLIDSAFILRNNSFEHKFPDTKEENVTKAYIQQRVNELVEYFMNELKGESAQNRHVLKSHLMSTIPCTMDTGEFTKYITTNLKECPDQSLKANIAYKIFDLFIRTKFIDPEEAIAQ